MNQDLKKINQNILVIIYIHHRLDLTIEQYDKWAIDTISTWQIKYPELAEKFYFDKIIYWYVPNAHNVEIKRNRVWMNHVFPILEKTWEQVEYYRLHPDELDRLYDIGMKRKKFYRLKTTFEINNNLVDKKILFLDDVPLDNPSEESPDVDCDFLDDDDEPVKITKKVKKKAKSKFKKNKFKKKINVDEACDFID